MQHDYNDGMKSRTASASSHADLCRSFEKKVGIVFRNTTLLETAFTHRSYLNEARAGKKKSTDGASHISGLHNERLEFLGDAVLEIVVTDYLFRTFPDATEGALTAYRAALVNAVMLASVAESLDMNDCLLLSKGEAKDTGRARATILANTFEAVVGALYLDQGIDAARAFIEVHLLPKVSDVIATGAFRDAKSEFQELSQAKYGITPQYETVSALGPDHARVFKVSVSVDGTVIATGEGRSKQEAEQDAARTALTAEKQ